MAFNTILFVGNSLTRHPPSVPLNWPNNWGMAATQEQLDYAHWLVRFIGNLQGTTPSMSIISSDLNAMAPGIAAIVTATDPDLTIIQMGDNASLSDTQTDFDNAYDPIIDAVQANLKTVVVIGTWAAPGDDGNRNNYIFNVAATQGGVPFVNIYDLHTFGAEAAFVSDDCEPDVCWHPGDRGMRLIAARIMTVMYPGWTPPPETQAARICC